MEISLDSDPSISSKSRFIKSPGLYFLISTIKSLSVETFYPLTATITSDVVKTPSDGPSTAAIPTPVAVYGSKPK